MNSPHPDAKSLAELQDLDYFVLKDGQLIVDSGQNLPKILDMHTHMGLSYALGRKIDVRKKSKPILWYDYSNDVDVLFEENHPTKKEKNRIIGDIIQGVVLTSSRNRTHTAVNLLEEMRRMNYSHCCLAPIANFLFGQRNVKAGFRAWNEVDKNAFIPFAATTMHKKWSNRSRQELDDLLKRGAKAIKFHPEMQLRKPDSKGALDFFKWCADGARNVPVLMHIGFTKEEPEWMQSYSEPRRIREALDTIPKLRIVLAHSGLRAYRDVLCIAKEFPDNVWLETSGLAVPALQRILDSHSHKRIVYGSDWPFYPLAVSLARILVAIDRVGVPNARADILFNNASDLLDLP